MVFAGEDACLCNSVGRLHFACLSASVSVTCQTQSKAEPPSHASRTCLSACSLAEPSSTQARFSTGPGLPLIHEPLTSVAPNRPASLVFAISRARAARRTCQHLGPLKTWKSPHLDTRQAMSTPRVDSPHLQPTSSEHTSTLLLIPPSWHFLPSFYEIFLTK